MTNQAKKIFEKILQSTAWRFRTRPTATTAPTYKTVIWGHPFLFIPCNGSLKQEDRAEMPPERWKLRPSQWRIRVMVSVLKIGGLFKITCRKVSIPVRSSPIVLITCLPYIQSPTEIPKPPNKRIDGGVLPTCDTWPSVQINQIAINGPIAFETSLPPCVNAPKHAVKIFYTRSFLLNNQEIPSSKL